jgi:hypothetical protein
LGSVGAHWLTWRLRQFAPDFILCTRHAAHLGPRLIDRIAASTPTAFWYFDAPERPAVLDLARRVERTYVVSHRVGDWLRSMNVASVESLPQGADLDLDVAPATIDARYHCDLSFIGSGQYPHRWPLLQRLAGEATMQIRGPGWGMAPADLPVVGGEIRGAAFASAVAAAKVSLGVNALPSQDDDPGAVSNRLWKVLAIGGAFLGQWVPGAEALAQDKVHCRWYRSPAEASEVLAELLADPVEREAMAARGRDYVRAHHSYDQRLGVILGERTSV